MSKAHCSKIIYLVLVIPRHVFARIVFISLPGNSVFLQIAQWKNHSVCFSISIASFLHTKQYTAAKRLQSEQCNLPTHQGRPAADPALIIPLCLATILFATRIFAKSMRISGSWGWDDYTIIVAYVSLLLYPHCCNKIHHSNVHWDFGRDCILNECVQLVKMLNPMYNRRQLTRRSDPPWVRERHLEHHTLWRDNWDNEG